MSKSIKIKETSEKIKPESGQSKSFNKGKMDIGELAKSVHKEIRPQLAASTDLQTFLETTGKLSLSDMRLLVEQALILLETTYVHMPLKRAMHAVDPVQRLKLLKYRLDRITEEKIPNEIRFHNEMTEIFTSVRDLHTNYLLPAPFNDKTAYLPFLIEECFENDQQKYLLTNIWLDHPTFKSGVEVLYWNGIPIEKAVELNADRQAGSNLEARHARGLDSLTIRPMIITLPPDEEWVVIGYRSMDGEKLEFRQPWLVFSPEPGTTMVDPNSLTKEATALGIDIKTAAIHQAKKVLFASEAVAAEKKIAKAEIKRAAPPLGLETSMPTVLMARNMETSNGTFGYIRIFEFDVGNADEFVAEFVRLTESLSQNGLIIDVRGNGGGLIYASERLLQVLAPQRISPEPAQFINTPLTLEICRLHSPSNLLQDFDLSSWVGSIHRAVETGATFSQGFPITSKESCNIVGQKYYGPVILITDALCYSATDIFAAGFQDNNIGPILGTSWNTGAGGANVWTHELLQLLMSEQNPPFQPLPNSPFKPLPNEAGMRVSIRRFLRVNERAGMPLEDLGVVPDHKHEMTKEDILNGNIDLINHAAGILATMPVYKLSAETHSQDGTLSVEIMTENISRLDVFLDDRPQQSLNVSDGPSQFDLTLPQQGASLIELQGFKDNLFVAKQRIEI